MSDNFDSIKLIVGLGNPGPSYSKHRHNVGVWLIDLITKDFNLSLKSSSKLKAKYVRCLELNDVILATPEVFMNNSGKPIQSMLGYFNLKIDQLLVVHDDLDIVPGVCKLKFGGGHGGHNGLRDIIQCLGGEQNFWRLRVGIGHPGHKSAVHNYVLSSPNEADLKIITESLWRSQRELSNIVIGNFKQAMQNLHTTPKSI